MFLPKAVLNKIMFIQGSIMTKVSLSITRISALHREVHAQILDRQYGVLFAHTFVHCGQASTQ